jgi:MFS transporter, putative metabolite:H+ symporter
MDTASGSPQPNKADGQPPHGSAGVTKKTAWLAVLVAALGYFVDIYDLVLFGVLRVSSLTAIGFKGQALTEAGLTLLNLQMIGMLVGGIVWGVLGDKRGRVSVLFGSILLYSLANIGNGFVTEFYGYAVFRVLAGIGLAGELGAGITLVSESLEPRLRGIGTTVVAAVGICGGVVAGLVGDHLPWRVAYFVGGGLGLLLLLMRAQALESSLFEESKTAAFRGSFLRLFAKASRIRRYVSIVLVAVPVWYVVGILVTLAPELGRAFGMSTLPEGGKAIMYCYAGVSLGDVASGYMSQRLQSRRKVLLVFAIMLAFAVAAFFRFAHQSVTSYYVCSALMGFATGYWAVFVTVAAEQFGTNLRATATTTAPNFVRASLVPITLLFRGLQEPFGIVRSAVIVGVIVITMATIAIASLDETYGKSLDFVEE